MILKCITFSCVRTAAGTLRAVRANDAHGTDPVRRNLGHEWVKDLETGGVYHQDFWVMSVAQETSLPLCANGELIKLQRGEKEFNEKWFIMIFFLSNSKMYGLSL